MLFTTTLFRPLVPGSALARRRGRKACVVATKPHTFTSKSCFALEMSRWRNGW